MAGREILAHVGAGGAITAEDALAVRRSVYGGDVAITPDEMDSGHLPALAHPVELATRLDAYWTDR